MLQLQLDENALGHEIKHGISLDLRRISVQKNSKNEC